MSDWTAEELEWNPAPFTTIWVVRTEQARAESLLLAPPDAVPVFDGVFLLRPQLNDAWGLRIFLEIDFQETLGCPTV
jgi:hypothetical protein